MRKMLLLVLCLLSEPLAANDATGVVFADENRNGRRDAGEHGIADVAVSNGREVVRTGNDGRYRLAVGDDTALFVIKPSGWTAPVNAQQLPRFYYLHKPEGSPDSEYPGVAPTGPLPDSVDFPLHRQDEPDRFRVLVFGDPQPTTRREVDYYARDIVDELVGVEGVAFGISLGDITNNDLELFDAVNTETARIGVPWHYVYGNHDMNFDAARDELADETFESVYGPPTRAFEYAGVHFVILDDVIYPREPGSRRYIGGLRSDQLEFVKNYLALVPRTAPLVFAMHIPLFDETLYGDTFRDADREALFALLRDRPHTLSLSAHTHTQRHHWFGTEEGWQGDEPHHHYNVGTTSGSWWSGAPGEHGIPHTTMRDGTPNGYAFIGFDGADYTIDWRVAGRPADYQVRLSAPEAIRRGQYPSARLYANVFNGDEHSRVEFRVGDGEWRPMQRVKDYDPLIMRIAVEQDTANPPPPGTRLPYPEPVHHLWRATLPLDREPGMHAVEVRATLRDGRVFEAATEYRLID